MDDDPPAAQALADVVVRLAVEDELDVAREEGTEALTRLADEAEAPQHSLAVRKLGGKPSAEQRADSAVVVRDRVHALVGGPGSVGRDLLTELAAARPRHLGTDVANGVAVRLYQEPVDHEPGGPPL